MGTLLRAFTACLMLVASLSAVEYSARLIHFTDDGTETGAPLFPEFDNNSCWSGIGASSDGNIYVSAGNHEQPADSGDTYGNVALYKILSGESEMSLLGDLTSVSTAAGNWMADESQHKVHTVITEHADGKLYFGSDDYEPSYFVRGSHIYCIDPAAGDSIIDYSASQPFCMKKDFSVIPNAGTLSDTAGVFIQYYGIKGMSMNPNAPDVLYAMLFGYVDGNTTNTAPGYIIKYTLSTGAMAKVGEAAGGAFIFHTDNAGNAYYADGDGHINKYDLALDTVTIVNNTNIGGMGAIAPTADNDTVYILDPASKNIYRFICSTGAVQLVKKACGSNWWRLFNLTLSRDGKYLYYISNNNESNRKGVMRMDVASGACLQIIDIDDVNGSGRTLAFGGINVWDNDDNFYVPVWGNSGALAIMQVHVDETSGITAPVATADDVVLHLWPSPIVDKAVFDFGHYHAMGAELTVRGLDGQVVQRVVRDSRSNRYVWDAAGAPAGFYLYSVEVDGQRYTGKFMKK